MRCIKYTKSRGLFLILILVQLLAFSQSKVDINSITDNQLLEFVKEVEKREMTETQVLELARLRGFSESQISQVRARLNALGAVEAGEKTVSSNVTNGEVEYATPAVSQKVTPISSGGGKIFGTEYFGALGLLSFEPNLTINAPEDYRLSSGDQLFIDIYGESEQYFDAPINEQGSILLSNVGPIPVNGLTVSEAENRIRTKLSSLYTGMKGVQPNTFIKVSLGNIKTIRIDVVGEVIAPGSYKVSGFNTVFNAFYIAGGITEKGTFRSIKHFRNNQLFQTVDLYDFLIKGYTDSNLILQNGDVLMVDTYGNRVEISGGLKRPVFLK